MTQEKQEQSQGMRYLMLAQHGMVALGGFSGFAFNALAMLISFGLLFAGPRWLQSDNWRLMKLNAAIMILGLLPILLLAHSVIMLPQVSMESLEWHTIIIKSVVGLVAVVIATALKVYVGILGIGYFDSK